MDDDKLPMTTDFTEPAAELKLAREAISRVRDLCHDRASDDTHICPDEILECLRNYDIHYDVR